MKQLRAQAARLRYCEGFLLIRASLLLFMLYNLQ